MRGVDAEVGQVPRRRQRHRDVLVAAVQPRRQPGLDEPAEAALPSACDRPQFAVAVVHEHDDAASVGQPGKERQPVLGVDHHVRPHLAQRPESDAREHHRQARPDVYGVGTARAVDPNAVDDLVLRGACVARRPQCHLDPGFGQLSADALQVCLAAAALRVAGIAPAQQQRLSATGVRWWTSVPA